jgi:hypothetical protein
VFNKILERGKIGSKSGVVIVRRADSPWMFRAGSKVRAATFPLFSSKSHLFASPAIFARIVAFLGYFFWIV